jgi:hypothetical protein
MGHVMQYLVGLVLDLVRNHGPHISWYKEGRGGLGHERVSKGRMHSALSALSLMIYRADASTTLPVPRAAISCVTKPHIRTLS